jgi:hypothetical protein
MVTGYSLFCAPVIPMDMGTGVPAVWVGTGVGVGMRLWDRENVGGTSAIIYVNT